MLRYLENLLTITTNGGKVCHLRNNLRPCKKLLMKERYARHANFHWGLTGSRDKKEKKGKQKAWLEKMHVCMLSKV